MGKFKTVFRWVKFTPLVTRAFAIASDPTCHQSQRAEVHEKLCCCSACVLLRRVRTGLRAE
jgi:hypothetical protein